MPHLDGATQYHHLLTLWMRIKPNLTTTNIFKDVWVEQFPQVNLFLSRGEVAISIFDAAFSALITIFHSWLLRWLTLLMLPLIRVARWFCCSKYKNGAINSDTIWFYKWLIAKASYENDLHHWRRHQRKETERRLPKTGVMWKMWCWRLTHFQILQCSMG